VINVQQAVKGAECFLGSSFKRYDILIMHITLSWNILAERLAACWKTRFESRQGRGFFLFVPVCTDSGVHPVSYWMRIWFLICTYVHTYTGIHPASYPLGTGFSLRPYIFTGSGFHPASYPMDTGFSLRLCIYTGTRFHPACYPMGTGFSLSPCLCRVSSGTVTSRLSPLFFVKK
jgi:hypothetical protein